MTLKIFLETTGISVAELSRKTGIPHATLLSYVKGTHEPSLRNALAIEEATLGAVKVENMVKELS